MNNIIKKKILYVEDGIGFGGSIISLAETIKGLLITGNVESTVFNYQEPEVMHGIFPSCTNIISHKRLFNYRVRNTLSTKIESSNFLRKIRWPIMKFYALLDGAYSFYLSCILLRIIKKRKIDIIHSNNGFQPEVIRAAAWSNRPIIIHLRGGSTNTAELIKTTNQWKKQFKKVLYKGISISNFVADGIIEGGFPKDKMVTIYNPVDLSLYEKAHLERFNIREGLGIDEQKIVVSIFGRVTRWKGTLEFIMAAKLAASQCKDIVFLVVGDASDAADPDYEKQVRSVAASQNLKGKVIFTGYQNKVHHYYAASDIVVHASIEPEPFGRVVIEAMACAKPVIAMNEGGPVEIITHGYNGILLPPKNIEQMSKEIQRLYHDKELRNLLGANAKNTVSERFINREIGQMVGKLYDSCPN